MTKPVTVSEYIAQAPDAAQKNLKQMRRILKKSSPKATEEMKWGQPAFLYDRILFIYGGFKNHIGFYITTSTLAAFKKDLGDYKITKGSIQFPNDEPLPATLIQKIAKYRIKELVENDVKWM